MSAADSQNTIPQNTISPDDQLPPVEPPSAGFVVQLFVIPALIVLIMFVVGAGIKLLVEQGNNPRAYVEALRRNNDGRWQAAHDLADALRNQSNPEIKDDAELATELAGMLNHEIDEGGMDKKPLEMRIYLCHALGAFHVPEVLPALVKAAETERDEREAPVRFAAMSALAVWLDSSPEKAAARVEVVPVALAVSHDERPLLRSTAAFALGAADTSQAHQRLYEMLADRTPDVRYNAATSLARHGDERAVPVLAEMLNPKQSPAVELENDDRAREGKRNQIVLNGLRAAKELSARAPRADLAPLAKPLQRLTADDLPDGIRVGAEEVLLKLKVHDPKED
jgi:HEAT repeat protein